ncbi:MAG: diguanylate cyclase, partial [Lachnospiraceae bacterium]|nr:diguanylate cyclase [Lachnospiraceae bacterium]
MKTKLDDRYRILLWWLLLIVALIFGAIVTNRLRARIEKTSYSDISKTSENRLADIEKDFDYAVSLLELLGTEEMESDDIFRGSEKKLTFVQKQLDAKSVGIYDCSASEIIISDGTEISADLIAEFFSDDFETAYEMDTVKLVRERTIFEDGAVAVMVPVKEKSKNVGIAFAVFDVESYVDIISKNVYNGAGYCMLSDTKGNILIPSKAFKEYEGNDKDLSEDEFLELFTGLDETGTSFMKVERMGVSFYVYARLFSSYPDYALVTVIDEISVFQNISPATKGIVAVVAMVLVVTLAQSIYYVTTYRKTKHEFDDVLNFDELTGLPTKTHHKSIALSLLRKSRGNYAYAACDVSEFKYFNSTFSYEYGNTALKYIANVMSDAMLKDETVSRTSGDHFAMLLHYNDTDELTERLMRILDTASVLPPSEDGRGPRAGFAGGFYLIGKESDIN